MLFLIVYIFEKIFLKSNFSIKNPIVKMLDCDFSIQDSVQWCLLQSWLSIVLKALENESSWEKNHI